MKYNILLPVFCFLLPQQTKQIRLTARQPESYTKSDWIVWTATLAGKRADFDALINPVYTYLTETTRRKGKKAKRQQGNEATRQRGKKAKGNKATRQKGKRQQGNRHKT